MRRSFVSLVLVGLAVCLLAADPVKVATDPEQAGPDFAVQGEYVGAIAGAGKLGAEVVARGDGSFLVNFLPGGLRGDGGDYSKSVEASAKTEGSATAVTTKDGKWSATIAKGRMTGKTEDGKDFSLERTVRKSPTLGAKAPAGAVVLFDGTNADEWKNGKVVDGSLLGSDIASKREFQDQHVHVEFRLSFMPFGRGQGRSNSGFYLQHRYEVQVLDSFGLKGANNECGGIYSQAAPIVNMCYPPLQWQTYDIDFKTARFDADGKKTSPAVVTIRHNGVVIHDQVAIKGPTGGGQPENAKPGPLYLQGHGGQVQYRNIWVEAKEAK